MTVWIRDDDVLVHSRAYTDDQCEGRFRGVHNLITSFPDTIHRPAILVTEIQDFPRIIDYIGNQIPTGTMEPQFHGLRHIDYGKLSYEEICEHIGKGQEKAKEWFGVYFKRFYTPWGANTESISRACSSMGMVLVDCKDEYYPADKVSKDERVTSGFFENKEIMIHWWEGIGKLERALKALRSS